MGRGWSLISVWLGPNFWVFEAVPSDGLGWAKMFDEQFVLLVIGPNLSVKSENWRIRWK